MRVLNTNTNITDRERFVIPNSMCLNNNFAIINLVYDNAEKQYLHFEWLSSREMPTIKNTDENNINYTVKELISGNLDSLIVQHRPGG